MMAMTSYPPTLLQGVPITVGTNHSACIITLQIFRWPELHKENIQDIFIFSSKVNCLDWFFSLKKQNIEKKKLRTECRLQEERKRRNKPRSNHISIRKIHLQHLGREPMSRCAITCTEDKMFLWATTFLPFRAAWTEQTTHKKNMFLRRWWSKWVCRSDLRVQND